MDIPPLVLKKRFGIPVSVTMYVMDFMVLIAQMTFGDRERILYGLIMVMIYRTCFTADDQYRPPEAR